MLVRSILTLGLGRWPLLTMSPRGQWPGWTGGCVLITKVVRRTRTTIFCVILLILQPHEVAIEQVDSSRSIGLGEKQRET